MERSWENGIEFSSFYRFVCHAGWRRWSADLRSVFIHILRTRFSRVWSQRFSLWWWRSGPSSDPPGGPSPLRVHPSHTSEREREPCQTSRVRVRIEGCNGTNKTSRKRTRRRRRRRRREMGLVRWEYKERKTLQSNLQQNKHKRMRFRSVA